MQPVPRLGLIAGTSLVTAAGTNLGIDLVKARPRNSVILRTGKDNEINDTLDIDTMEDDTGIESPTDFNGGFIYSVLEDNEIPLVFIVNGLNILNYLEFSCKVLIMKI